MFLDLQGYGRRPEEPPPPPRRLSPQGEKVMLWVICVNILLLFIAPIAGGSVVMTLINVIRHLF